jgi:hypothetical protein
VGDGPKLGRLWITQIPYQPLVGLNSVRFNIQAPAKVNPSVRVRAGARLVFTIAPRVTYTFCANPGMKLCWVPAQKTSRPLFHKHNSIENKKERHFDVKAQLL